MPQQLSRDNDEIRIWKNQGFFGVTKPVTVRVPSTTAQTAANYPTPFFIADRPYYVIDIVERHEVAGGAPGDATVDVLSVPSGTAPGSGSSLLSSTISLAATANVNQTASLSTVVGRLRLNTGTALSLKAAGTLTTVEGVTVAVTLRSI